jgi:hypothetical protein
METTGKNVFDIAEKIIIKQRIAEVIASVLKVKILYILSPYNTVMKNFLKKSQTNVCIFE